MITSSDYTAIVCWLVESQSVLQYSYDSIVDTQAILVNIDTTETKRIATKQPMTDLLSKLSQQIVNPLPELLGAVQALQRHVVKYYGSLSEFYESNDVTVPAVFATLSRSAGYTVDSEFIAESC